VLAIQNFQQRLFSRYRHSLSLPARYNFYYGNPVQPVVPPETTTKAVCLIGDSPPARLGTVGPEQELPLENIGRPFSLEPYFDGRRVRSETPWLEQLYLTPLGLRREQCWLTYLVKVFLFKDEHLARYRRLGCPWPERETSSQFDQLARQGLGWLEEELALLGPKVVITLGAAVAGVLQDVRGLAGRETLLTGHLQDLWLGEGVYPVIHLARPTPTPGDVAVASQVVARLVR
jgi:hypothetical protein